MDMAEPGDPYGADLVVVGFSPPPTAEPEAIAQARVFARAIRETCRPLDERDLMVELTKLRMKAAHRPDDTMDGVFLLEAYVDALKNYPADLAIEAVRGWAEQSKFWPTVHELTARLGWRIEQRKGLLRALETVAQAEARAVA